MKAIYLKDNNGNKVVTVPYYRVGDLFLTTIATNPGEYLGGTWELFGPGRTLVCVDTSDSNFNTVKKTGGASTHSHSQGSTGSTALTIDQIPSHTHDNILEAYWGGAGNTNSEYYNIATAWGTDWNNRNWMNYNGYTGGGQGHTHTNPNTNSSSSLQPFITCYIWIRTA